MGACVAILFLLIIILAAGVFYFLFYDTSMVEKKYCTTPISNPISGRYIKFSSLSTGQTIACNDIEVYVYNDVDTLSDNIANSNTITTSSVYGTMTPNNLKDKNINTSFITGNNTPGGEWIQLDLGKNYTISHIIYNNNTSINTYLINGIILTIQDNDKKVVYTSLPFKDPTGSSAILSVSSPAPSQYKMYIIHPPYTTPIGHLPT